MTTIVFMITHHPNSYWSAMTLLDWNGDSNWMKPAAYPFIGHTKPGTIASSCTA